MLDLDYISKIVAKFVQKEHKEDLFGRVTYRKLYTDTSKFWIAFINVDGEEGTHTIVIEGDDKEVYTYYQFENNSSKAYDCFLSEINECC